MELTLQPMNRADFEHRSVALREDYARALQVARGVSLAAARAQAARQLARLLPYGIDSERVLLRTATVGGTAVGWIWVTLPGSPGGPDPAWIHHLGVDPEHQGHGYGRAMIEAIEIELAGYRVDRLGLNVFGDNVAAIRLYESLGFRVTAQQMAKSLRPPGQRPADPG